jgi:SAM-dependent methyltransferase
MAENASNEQQATYWTETAGPHWVQQQEMFDYMLSHFGAAALANLAADTGEHIIDIGCGTATTTMAIANSVGPTGSVIGADISRTMIEAARRRAATVPNATFVVADAQIERIAPVNRDADAMFSRFGVMFFADPVAAFTNLAANVRPGGRAAFVCWQHESLNEWISVPAGIMRGFTPNPIMPIANAPGPFAFRDRDRLRSILADAGWSTVGIESFSAPTTLGAGKGLEAAVTQSMSSVAGETLRAQTDDATYAAAREAVRAAFSERIIDGAVTFPGNVWLASARR